MGTVKYVLKRLLMALFILFGVSIIIYALARFMPTDFIDNQYSSAVQQGTMQQEDVDRIKELYGLNMPDAYLSFTNGQSENFAKYTFTKDTKAEKREEADLYKNTLSSKEFGEGEADIEAFTASYIESYEEILGKWFVGSYDKGNYRLVLKNSTPDKYAQGTYTVYEVTKGEVVVEGEGDNQVVKVKEILTEKESGTYTVKVSVDENRVVKEALLFNGTEIKLSYRVASGWNKFTALLSGYFGWLGKMLRGDLGVSFKYKRPVGEVIKQNMGISFSIALIATILEFLIAIPLGIKAATHQYGAVDYFVTVFSMIGISLPTFFLAALFIRIFALKLGWFDVGGLTGSISFGKGWFMKLVDTLYHMILPMTVLVILSIGGLMRYTRTNTLEVLSADYIRTARAKGLSERTVVYKHAFKNTMIPLVTMMAGILPGLFGGAMITETVFSIPGIGKLAYDALIVGDIPFIMGYNMFIAILTVLGTLLSDLMYAVVDPRVKIGR